MDAPLLNDYKKYFVIRRLLTTFLGGLKIYFPSSVPAYIYFVQIILFAIPSIACGIFLNVLSSELMEVYVAALANGCTTGLFALLIQVFAILMQRQARHKDNVQELDSFGDEEIYFFDSFWGPRTWLFLIPPKKTILGTFLSSCVAGVTGGFCLWYLHQVSNELESVNPFLGELFTGLGMSAYSVGIFPLIVGSPPEPAIFHQLPYDLQDLSRSSHMLTCFLAHGLTRLYPDNVWVFYADCTARAIFVLSPFLWLIGTLPPIDSYVLWALEQWLVIFLGGSPCSSNLRLLVQASVGTFVLLILASMPSFLALILASAVFGFMLSLNWDSLVPLLGSRPMENTWRRLNTPAEGRRPCFQYLEFLVYTVFLFGVLCLSCAVHIPCLEWYSDQVPDSTDGGNRTSINVPRIFQSGTIDLLWYCLLLLSIVVVFLHVIQASFFVFWRNPFSQRQRSSEAKGYLLVSHLVRCGGPFVSLLFLHTLLGVNSTKYSFDKKFSLEALFQAISFEFIFRQIWQLPEHNVIVLSGFFIVEKAGGEHLRTSFWGRITPSVRIHLFNLFFLWVRGSVGRLKSIIMFSYTAIAESKQRKTINFFLVGMNCVLAPFLLILCCFCSILQFPLFPLFTLPFFLVGFPRPLRFWSYPIGYSANRCPDTVYYEQLAPYVARGFHSKLLSGGLGMVYPGDFFLLRWEDRLLLVQILEVGFVYVAYSFKGLELQETSCHTTEASRVDSIFSRAFDSMFSEMCFNYYFFHCLTPLTKFNAVGYSDTRNVLTGILDSPETLKVIRDYFLKSFLYFALTHAHARKEEISTVSRPPSAVSRLDSATVRTRKAFTNLPKAEKVSASRATINTPAGEESPSVISQNGRGSRLAWVSDSKVTTGALRREVKLLGSQSTLKEEKTDGVVIRPASWDSTDDPLESKLTITDPRFQFSQEEVSIKRRALHDLNTVKNSYVLPISPLNEVKIKTATNVGTLSNSTTFISDSDSDTEITKEFYLKNYPLKTSQIPGEADLASRRNSRKSNRRRSLKVMKSAYKCSLSASLSPILNWISDDVPFDEETLEDMQDAFPLSWFRFLLKHFGLLKINQAKSLEVGGDLNTHDERLIELLLSDEYLEESYRTLLAVAHIITHGTDDGYPSTSQVFRMFNGDLPSSRGAEWLRKRPALLALVLKSYRIGVKLSLDHTLVSPINTCWSDLVSALQEYDTEWYVGPDSLSSPAASRQDDENLWNDAVAKEVPSLFSLGYNDIKGTYTSHLLTLGEADINVGSMDAETVRSIWTSLTGELLYLTNDDDERYSIQAHPILLRNLTIQAADPPLGYPIYSSPSVFIGLNENL